MSVGAVFAHIIRAMPIDADRCRSMPIDADPGVARPPLMPTFVIGFLVLATINFLGLIPEVVSKLAGNASRRALLIAIAGVGMKSSLKHIFDVGGQAITLILAETLFIGVVILIGIALLADGG